MEFFEPRRATKWVLLYPFLEIFEPTDLAQISTISGHTLYLASLALVLTGSGKDDAKHLEGRAKRFWQEFNNNSAKEALMKLEPVPKIKIPGGKLFLTK